MFKSDLDDPYKILKILKITSKLLYKIMYSSTNDVATHIYGQCLEIMGKYHFNGLKYPISLSITRR